MEGSWVLVLTVFATFFIEMGTVKSFGVLFNPMQESLLSSTAQLGTVLGMTHSLGLLLAPLTGNIARTFDHRLCVITGGGLLFVGCFVSAFVHNVYQLAITLTITGIGLSLAYIPQVLLLLKAFPTRFSLIFGIAGAGGSFGMMVCPPIVEILTNTYGWRGAMMISAAMVSHVFAFGALQRLPKTEYAKLKVTSTAESSAEKRKGASSCLRGLVSSIIRRLSLQLCIANPRVLLHLTTWLLLGANFHAWVVFLVPHATTRGIGSTEAAFLSTVGGIGHFIGRVIHPFILDYKITTAFGMFLTLSVLNTLSFFVDRVVGDNCTALMFLAFVNGGAIGTINLIIISVSKEIYEERYHVDIFVLGNCLFGAGEILGGYLAGGMYDLTRSYSASFLSLGVMSALTLVMTIADRLASQCSSEHD
ncbi:monocarboxylate transporter 13-like [Acanthaster planci]|uniref:Monocarboxylate transporter 13-like n=1 Tax=Acanthaster planci TaxID=133434 RepID=A0A8B7YUG7_ACAPL|nr:monocarboxylate transporter 13-like [Acanthaster planci]